MLVKQNRKFLSSFVILLFLIGAFGLAFFYFSPQTLKRLLEDNGFKILECITKNFSLAELKGLILKKRD